MGVHRKTKADTSTPISHQRGEKFKISKRDGGLRLARPPPRREPTILLHAEVSGGVVVPQRFVFGADLPVREDRRSEPLLELTDPLFVRRRIPELLPGRQTEGIDGPLQREGGARAGPVLRRVLRHRREQRAQDDNDDEGNRGANNPSVRSPDHSVTFSPE